MLLRAAKVMSNCTCLYRFEWFINYCFSTWNDTLQSRSKLEDPEQLKLKQKAKEMQRAEMEEARQREANETALLAIGPRKKLKTGDNGIAQSSSGLTNHSNSFPNHFASPFASTGSSKPVSNLCTVTHSRTCYSLFSLLFFHHRFDVLSVSA